MSRQHHKASASRLALALLIAAQPLGAPAWAQAFRGTEDVRLGIVDRGIVTLGVENIFVSSPQAIINWTPDDNAIGGPAIDFLPAGSIVNFQSANGAPYTVLNRVLTADVGRAVALNGIVNSDAIGAVWFYAPGGLLIGGNAQFNVGSLLLTANDPVGAAADQPFLNGSSFSLAASAASTAAVTVNAGAQFNLPGASSYLIAVAPRIQYAGTASVNGSAALVQASAVDFTLNGGLFDISATLGSTATQMDVAGSITGPASSGAGDFHRIYLMAVPRNDAMTMLISGGANLGFDVAAAADVVGNAIVLSGGHNILATPEAAPFGAQVDNATSTVSLTGGNFTSAVAARASNTAALDAAAGASFAGDLLLIGSNARLTSGDGTIITVGGNLLVDASGLGNSQQGGAAEVLLGNNARLTVTGVARLDASGFGAGLQGIGTAEAGFGGLAELRLGNGANFGAALLDVLANGVGGPGFVGAGSGNGTGGTARITAGTSALVTIGGTVAVDARGIGGFVSGNGAAGSGLGGTAGVALDTNARMSSGELLILANGLGGFVEGTATGGGNATGGSANLGVGTGGLLVVGGPLTATASATASFGSGGSAIGGAVGIINAGTAFINGVNEGPFVDASATGGSNFGGPGGNARAGNIQIINSGALNIAADFSVVVSAIGQGGESQGGAAGSGEGGAITLRGDAGSIDVTTVFGGLLLDARGRGGLSDVQMGDGRGGTASLRTGTGSITTNTGVRLDVTGFAGGDGQGAGATADAGIADIFLAGGAMTLGGALEAVAIGDGTNGLGFGGTANLTLAGNAALATTNVLLDGRSFGFQGGDGGFARLLIGAGNTLDTGAVDLLVQRDGSGRGGTAALGVDGILVATSLRMEAGAQDVLGTGATEGGFIEAIVSGRVTTGQLTMNGFANGAGVSGGGGSATGGRIDLSVLGSGEFTANAADPLRAEAAAAPGFAALGGRVTVNNEGTLSLLFAGGVAADARGLGGFGFAGAGAGTGGQISLISSGNTQMTGLADGLAFTAAGRGADSFGAAGAAGSGGSVAITATGGTLALQAGGGDVLLDAQGLGGAGGDTAGSGAGGAATLLNQGASITIGSANGPNGLALLAGGFTGPSQGAAGNGTGGSARLEQQAGSLTSTGPVIIDARGIGFAAGGGTATALLGGGSWALGGPFIDVLAGARSRGGDASGGAATLFVGAGTSLAGVAAAVVEAGAFAEASGTQMLTGGEARATLAGTSSLTDLSLLAGAGNAGATVGDAQGGTASLLVGSGSAQLLNRLVMEAFGDEAQFFNSGAGGSIDLTVAAGSSLAVNGSLSLSAYGQGAAADIGGTGTGGTITILNDGTLAFTTSGEPFVIDARGLGGFGLTGAGGLGTGGSIDFTNRGSFTFVDPQGGALRLAAGGQGGNGNGAGGNGVGGIARLANSGTATSSGALRLEADGRGGQAGSNAAGTGIGGQATLESSGGTLGSAGLFVFANAQGQAAQGGNAGIVISNGGQVNSTGAVIVNASAVAAAGNASAGTVRLALGGAGAALAIAGGAPFSLLARAQGGTGGSSGGTATGGLIDIAISNGASYAVPANLLMDAGAAGGAGTDTGGQASGGTIQLSTASGGSASLGGAISVTAAGGAGATGGAAVGGSIALLAAGAGSAINGGDLTLSTLTSGGNGTGAATGGSISFAASDGAAMNLGAVTADNSQFGTPNVAGRTSVQTLSGGTVQMASLGISDSGNAPNPLPTILAAGGGAISVAGNASIVTRNALIMEGNIAVGGLLSASAAGLISGNAGLIDAGNMSITSSTGIDLDAALLADADISLFGPIPISVASVDAGGNVTIDGSVVTTGAVRADGILFASGSTSLTMASASAGNRATLLSDGALSVGAVDAGVVQPASNAVGDAYIRALGPITTGAVSVASNAGLVAGGTISAGVITAGQNMVLLAGGDVGVAGTTTAATGTAYFGNFSQRSAILFANGVPDYAGVLAAAPVAVPGSITVSGPISTGRLLAAATGTIAVQAVTAAQRVQLDAGGLVTLGGSIASPIIEVASGDIAIGADAQIGSGAATRINLLARNDAGATVGGSTAGAGYRLSGAEFARLRASSITLTVANGRPLALDALALTGSGLASGGNSITLATNGNISVTGAITMNGAGAGDALRLAAGGRLRVNSDTGSIILGPGADAPLGRLALLASDIEVASGALLGQLDNGLAGTARNQALDAAASVPDQGGRIAAGRLELLASRSLLIQNTGSAALRAGFTAGGGGMTVTQLAAGAGSGEQGLAIGSDPRVGLPGISFAGSPLLDMVINGRAAGEGGSYLTNNQTRSVVGLFPGESVFTATSSINGCIIGGPCPGSDGVITSIINNIEALTLPRELARDAAGRSMARLPLLIFDQLYDLASPFEEPDITEPVAGAGNPALWLTPTPGGPVGGQK